MPNGIKKIKGGRASMTFGERIAKIRKDRNITQAEFAEKFGITHQSVQKWESGATMPDIGNIIKISKSFNVSVDYLLFGNDARTTEEYSGNKKISPSYESMAQYEDYADDIAVEYEQAASEGLDIAKYKKIFDAVADMEKGRYKSEMADILFDIVLNAPTCEGYKYCEPSDYGLIKESAVPYAFEKKKVTKDALRQKVLGAWYGRICGCLLGKPIEGIRSGELTALLKETGNYPMSRYIKASEITDEMVEKYKFPLANRCFVGNIECAPSDDDTNYTVLYQKIIEEYGRDFTPYDITRAWLQYQPKNAYFTAERVAYCNFIKGYVPPQSAVYKNPYREWIGAQIRADYFGYINPGDPERAAEMAWRDACISHTKNGIYGEMFVASMLASAAVSDSITDIIKSGLGQIPASSRFYEAINNIINGFTDKLGEKECFEGIHKRWNEFTGDWCNTIANAEIVTAALLYGGGDFGKSICLAVQAAFDTDCNGATVGSVLGMMNGISSIDEEWKKPLNGMLDTQIFGVGRVGISGLAEKTMEHIKL